MILLILFSQLVFAEQNICYIVDKPPLHIMCVRGFTPKNIVSEAPKKDGQYIRDISLIDIVGGVGVLNQGRLDAKNIVEANKQTAADIKQTARDNIAATLRARRDGPEGAATGKDIQDIIKYLLGE